MFNKCNEDVLSHWFQLEVAATLVERGYHIHLCDENAFEYDFIVMGQYSGFEAIVKVMFANNCEAMDIKHVLKRSPEVNYFVFLTNGHGNGRLAL